MPVPQPGTHGGDAVAVARALGIDPNDLLDLSQTLNPFAHDAADLLARHLDSVRRYPDASSASEAHVALSEALGVDPGRLLLTNGGSEAIALVAATIGGRPLAEPEFGLHPRCADGPRWRSDPHNPTGVLAGDGERGDVDVWDEAFYPLATGRWTSGRGGTIVGSLTKVFACPGLRLGYVIDDDVERFVAGRAHWSVNSLALAVLPDLLAGAMLDAWRARIDSAREDLASVFTDAGFEVRAEDAPWVLVRAPGARDALAGRGVLVRDCSSFGLPDWIRVAVADADGTRRVAAAVEAIEAIA